MFRRHPILTVLGILALALLALAVTFVATFDLNSHRDRLARELSRSLQTPVSIGQARLSLHQGLALDFSDVRIGDEQTPGHAAIDHLYLLLELRPLLRREVSVSHIELHRPSVRLSGLPDPSAPPTPLRLPGDLRVESLRIHDGQVSWQALDPGRPPLVWRGVQGELRRQDSSDSLHLSLAALWGQDDSAARLNLAGTLEPPQGEDSLQAWQIDLKMQARGLALEQLAAYWPADQPTWSLGGRATLDAQISGSPTRGIHASGHVQGEKLSIRHTEKPLPLHTLSLDADGRLHEGRWHLQVQQIQADQVAVAGSLELTGGDHPARMRGQLSLPPLSIAQVLPWTSLAPPAIAEGLIALQPRGGSIHLRELVLEGPAAPDTEPWFGAQGALRQASLVVQGLELSTIQGDVRDIAGQLHYTPGNLEIREGQLRWHDQPVRLAGTVVAPFAGDPQLDLRVESSANAAQLAATLAQLPPNLNLDGELSLGLHLSGAPSAPLASLDADLTAVRLGVEDWLKKAAGTPARLKARGQWRAGRFIIEDAPGRCGPASFNLTGTLAPAARTLTLRLDLHETDLVALAELTPFLTPAGLTGKINGTLDFAWEDGQPKPLEGDFSVRDGGADFRGIVGDLNQAQGRILLAGNEVRLTGVSARLGESALRMQGRIADLRAPRLEIELEGSDLRPEDLIFPGTEGRLNSVAGRLVIDREGIAFSPVDAETAGGTRARVTGAVRDYHQPRVDLKIVADYGNVDEILVFFRYPRDHRPPPRKTGGLQVRIEVEAAGGVFHKIHFKNGEAVIRYQNRTLDIYPLHADLDPGYYVGRVLWANREDQPPLLVVSGTVRDGDAEKLYLAQAETRGLISGKLRGAFYLEGAGNNFWPTARGGLSLEVTDGVLRRFQVLSKVFSLLNVSQIFALRLPDMSLEGMPYSHLSANALVRDGRLTTEDLFIESPAMNLSLVGEVDLAGNTIDAVLGVKPLRTVDKIVTKIPIAGWILTGEEKALITAHFKVTGNRADPSVYPVPVTSLSEKVFGIFRRVLGLPGKVITDVGQALQGDGAEGD